VGDKLNSVNKSNTVDQEEIHNEPAVHSHSIRKS